MKQYDENEFTLISNEEKKTYQWLIKENIRRNRINGIISKIVIYTFVVVLAIAFIYVITKDIFFENYSYGILKNHEHKIDKINKEIKIGDDYGSLESPQINTKVHEIESRLDDVESKNKDLENELEDIDND
jgi:hypothetical protein